MSQIENVRYIRNVVETVHCKMHRVSAGIPCWGFTSLSGRDIQGICRVRIRAAGFVGKISESSLTLNRGPRGGKR